MFRQEPQKVQIMSVFSCIDLVIITDFNIPVPKPDKEMLSANYRGIFSCQENVMFSIISVFITSNFLFYGYYFYI